MPAALSPSLPRFALATLLPLCRDRFADRVHGGFHEQLDLAHNPRPARQQAADGAVPAALCAVARRRARRAQRRGRGGARLRLPAPRLSRTARMAAGASARPTDGAPMDATKDLYAHAFLLFALAWLHRAFAAPDAIALAAGTLDTLHARIAAPGGGFWDRATADWQPDRSLRRQNPHMHLLEALLALHEATGEARWLDEATALVRLFLDRFHDAPTCDAGGVLRRRLVAPSRAGAHRRAGASLRMGLAAAPLCRAGRGAGGGGGGGGAVRDRAAPRPRPRAWRHPRPDRPRRPRRSPPHGASGR